MSTIRIKKETTGASVQIDSNSKIWMYWNSVRLSITNAAPTVVGIETDGKQSFDLDTTQTVYVNDEQVTGVGATPVLTPSQIKDLLIDEVFDGDGGLTGIAKRLNDLIDVEVNESAASGRVLKKNNSGLWVDGADNNSGGGGGGAATETVGTYADIDQSDTSVRFIYVEADETNNGDKSLYLHNGTDLKLVQTFS